MKKILYNILILSLLQLSCSKDKNPNYKNIAIYGHAGVGFETYINRTPPNSFESFQKAIEVLSADGVETDVQIDQDGKLWLYHDELLEVKTGCEGCMGDLSSSYLSNCKYKGSRSLFSLEELIAYASSFNPKPKISIQAQIDNRCASYIDLGNALYQTFEKHNAYDWIQLESDSKDLLQLLRDSSASFQLYIDASEAQSGINDCMAYQLNGLIMFNDDVSTQEIKNIKAAGLKIGLYGVKNQFQAKNALNKFPDQIQTEDIELIHRLMYD